jgi:hypothetical protein
LPAPLSLQRLRPCSFVIVLSRIAADLIAFATKLPPCTQRDLREGLQSQAWPLPLALVSGPWKLPPSIWRVDSGRVARFPLPTVMPASCHKQDAQETVKNETDPLPNTRMQVSDIHTVVQFHLSSAKTSYGSSDALIQPVFVM